VTPIARPYDQHLKQSPFNASYGQLYYFAETGVLFLDEENVLLRSVQMLTPEEDSDRSLATEP
jgi:hypothetical protein